MVKMDINGAPVPARIRRFQHEKGAMQFCYHKHDKKKEKIKKENSR